MADRYDSKRHPIRVVARRTGLSRDVLRAWELRYTAVEPARTDGGQRLYSDADIERLRLLQKALDGGRRIGQVADLKTDELRQLVREDERARPPAGPEQDGRSGANRSQNLLAECLEALLGMDADRLAATLDRAAATLHDSELIEEVLTPLMVEIGDLWRSEQLTPAHERMATAEVRRTLDELRHSLQRTRGPAIVVATPAGQRHEIGALLAAAVAASEGWRVLYLGADLPAASIATAVRTMAAEAVALSIIYPPDDARLDDELRDLRDLLPKGVAVIVGGGAVEGYRDTLSEIGALALPAVGSLRATLVSLSAAGKNGGAARSG